MSIKRIYFLSSSKYNINNKNVLEKTKFVFVIVSIVFMMSYATMDMKVAYGSLNLDNFIQQTQENIQSAIESSDNTNKNECNNNISIQSQTNENGKTTSTTRNICDDGSTTTTGTKDISASSNLNGSIVSSEYDQSTGQISHSIFGNWSLTTKSDGSKDFSSSFVKKPVFYNNTSNVNSSSSSTIPEVIAPSENTSASPSSNPFGNDKDNNNITSYTLSNFVGNSVQQQNDDITYSGKIDVVQEIQSIDPNIPDELNTFKGIGVSISLVDNKVLIITFDSQSQLAKEFINIPIVGLIL